MLICLVVGTVLSYVSVLVSPAFFKLSAGISILIPVFIIINLLVFAMSLVKRSRKAVIPLILLVFAYPFLKVSIGLSPRSGETGDFSVMNYNVKWFVEGRGDPQNNVFDFVKGLNADIACFQEFHAARGNINTLNSYGTYEVIIDAQSSNLAILSKFKMLNSGVLFEGKRFNNIQFADLLITPGDTIRVYNLHLQSMGINTSNLQDTDGIREEYEEVKTRFLDGAVVRAGQIDHLMDHIEGCPYPLLIVGDFNDVPFSYNYFQFKKRFSNAFEEAGSGFGFTFNGRLPFLRIDNQFFGKGLKIEAFDTFSNANYSDHFPVLGIYSLSD